LFGLIEPTQISCSTSPDVADSVSSETAVGLKDTQALSVSNSDGKSYEIVDIRSPAKRTRVSNCSMRSLRDCRFLVVSCFFVLEYMALPFN
jgi:hypothetical protein